MYALCIIMYFYVLSTRLWVYNLKPGERKIAIKFTNIFSHYIQFRIPTKANEFCLLWNSAETAKPKQEFKHKKVQI